MCLVLVVHPLQLLLLVWLQLQLLPLLHLSCVMLHAWLEAVVLAATAAAPAAAAAAAYVSGPSSLVLHCQPCL
jgi:hypothetical protein